MIIKSTLLKHLCFLFLAITVVLSCKKGCLTCDYEGDSPICLLCDVRNNFVFDPETNFCKQLQILNCLNVSYEIKQVEASPANLPREIKKKITPKSSSKIISTNYSKDEFAESDDLSEPFSSEASMKTISSFSCLQCKQGYIFDFSIGRCKPVEIPIEGCKLYSNTSECVLCEVSKCLLLETQECVSYSDLPRFLKSCSQFSLQSAVCQQCHSGFTLLPIKAVYHMPDDFTFCVDSSSFFTVQEYSADNSPSYENNEGQSIHITPYSQEEQRALQIRALTSNCVEFSQFSCQECLDSTNVLLWKNPFSLSQDYLREKSSSVQNMIFQSQSPGFTITTDPPTFCVVQRIKNCAKYSQISREFTSCVKCEDNHFLSHNQCFKVKDTRIPNCYVYSSLLSCKKCNPGFIRVNDTVCIEQIHIPHCESIDAINACQKCEEGFYSGNEKSSCLPRVNSILNCKGTSDFNDNCYECEADHFLYLKIKHSSTSESGSFTQDDLHFDEFQDYTCYLRPRYPIPLCSEYSLYYAQCVQCESGYSLSVSGFSCLPNIPNCASMLEDITESSKDSFLINPTPEQIESQSANTVFTASDADFPSRSFCLECNPGFAPSIDKSACNSVVIPNCKVLSPHSGECLECENLFYFDVDPSFDYRKEIKSKCLPMTDENCLANLTNLPLCRKCKATFYIVPGETTTQATSVCTKMTMRTDPKCTSNTSTEDNGGCSSCLPGFASFKVFSHTGPSGYSLSQGCARFDRRTLECLECKVNYGSQHTPCDTLDMLSDCRKLPPFSSGGENLLLQNPKGHCVSCRDNSLFYMDQGLCIARNPYLYLNCETPDHSQDVCKECLKGTLPFPLTDFISCQPKPDSWVPTENCLTYDIQTQNCLFCVPGFEIVNLKCVFIDSDSDSSLRAKPLIWVPLWLDSLWKPIPHQIMKEDSRQRMNQSLITNCSMWIQSESQSMECVRCTGLGVIKSYRLSFKDHKSNFNLVTKQFEFFANQVTIHECLEDNTKVIQNNHSASSDFLHKGLCMFVEEVFDGIYLCVTCIPSHQQVVDTIRYSTTEGSIATRETLGVIDCVPNSEFQSKFQGLNLDYEIYKEQDLTNYYFTSFHHKILFDSCKDPAKVMIVFPYSHEKSLFKCINHSSIPTSISKCHIYQWFGDRIVNLNSQQALNWKCISCLPGFAPKFGTVEGSSFDRIVKCEPIAGCNLEHPENLWMNTCAVQALLPGYSYKVINSYKTLNTIFFGSLIKLEDQMSPQCLMWDDKSRKCTMCRPGFIVDTASHDCLEIDILNCQDAGIISKLLDKNYLISSHFGVIQAFMGILSMLNSLMQLPKESWEAKMAEIVPHLPGYGCNQCKSPSIPLHSTSASLFMCSKTRFFYLNPNCELYSAQLGKEGLMTCGKCDRGFTLNAYNECIKQSPQAYCALIKRVSFDKYECETCLTGFFKDENGNCMGLSDDHCLMDVFGGTGQGRITNPDYDWLEDPSLTNYIFSHQSESFCAICDENHVFSLNFPRKCVPNSDTDDVCLIRDSQNLCLKCRDPSLTPLNVLSPEEYIRTYCIDPSLNKEKSQFISKNFFSATKFIDGTELMSTVAGGSYFLDSGDWVVFNTEKNGYDISLNALPKFNCIKVPEISHCKAFDFDTKLVCVECEERFYLYQGICFPSKIKNCLQFQLDKVSNNKFGSSLKFTETHKDWTSPVTIAKMKYHGLQVKCSRCEDSYFIDFYGHCSAVHFDSFCENQLYSLENGNCLQCAPSHRLKSVHSSLGSYKQCIPYDLFLNCQSYESSTGNCLSCNEETFYFDSFDQQCIERTQLMPGCLLFSKGRKLCQICEENWYIDGLGKCSEVDPIENCLNYIPNSNDCFICEDGFFPQRNEKFRLICVPNPTGIAFCSHYGQNGECIQCIDSFRLLQSECHENPWVIENCAESIKNIECLRCKPGYLLEHNLCEPAENQNCLDNMDTLNCRACAPGSLLVNDRGFWDCETYSIPFCTDLQIKYEFITNDMLSYDVESYASRDHIDSLLRRFMKRQKYSADMAECLECSHQTVFDPEQKQCVALKAGQKLEGCVNYGAVGECQLCEKGYYLYEKERKCVQSNMINRDYSVSTLVYSGILKDKLESFERSSSTTKAQSLTLNAFFWCKRPTRTTQPVCIRCKPGFYISAKGNCTKCPADNCAHCLISNPRKCLICASGFYMHQDQIEQIFCVNNKQDTYEEYLSSESEEEIMMNTLPIIYWSIASWALIYLF